MHSGLCCQQTSIILLHFFYCYSFVIIISYMVYTLMSCNNVWWKTSHHSALCQKSRASREKLRVGCTCPRNLGTLPLPKDSVGCPDGDVHSTPEEEPNDLEPAVCCWSRSVYFTVKFMVLTCRSMQSTRFWKKGFGGKVFVMSLYFLWNNVLYFVTIKK